MLTGACTAKAFPLLAFRVTALPAVIAPSATRETFVAPVGPAGPAGPVGPVAVSYTHLTLPTTPYV